MKRRPVLEQLPEIIYIEGDLYTLYTTPLLPWLREQNPAFVFDQRTPQCERGYIGRWKIEKGTLWLTGFYAYRDGANTSIADLFGEMEEVEADWFTGPLVIEPSAPAIADGAYPKVSTLIVKAGRVVEN